jgi:N-acetylglutamate synthase-like GNAT family acetyltransferase
MGGIVIRSFEPGDEQGVTGVILPIQCEEFGVAITAADQPDLAAIAEFYLPAKGGFWVAVKDGRIVGTVGLKDIGNDTAALRKMFVAAEVRGREFGVAARLLAALFEHASDDGLKTILVGTTDRFVAAHRFYEKNGFDEIAPEDLPAIFRGWRWTASSIDEAWLARRWEMRSPRNSRSRIGKQAGGFTATSSVSLLFMSGPRKVSVISNSAKRN